MILTPRIPMASCWSTLEGSRDVLPSADFGKGTKRRWIKIQSKRFVVSVQFFSGTHGQAPLGYLEKAQSVRDDRAKLGAQGDTTRAHIFDSKMPKPLQPFCSPARRLITSYKPTSQD